MRIKDSFLRTGTDIRSFSLEVKEMDKITSFVPINLKGYTVLSVCRYDEDFVEAFRFSGSEPYEIGQPVKIARISTERLKEKGATDELIKELINGKTALYSDGELLLLSNAVNWGQLGLFGKGVAKPTHERNLLVASLFSEDQRATLVVKKEKELQKVFAIRSPEYAPIKQESIIQILEGCSSLGSISCSKWYIDNFFTEIVVNFPDVADDISKTYDLPHKLTPGIRVTTSDTGDCSLRVEGIWLSASNSVAMAEKEVSRKHIGKVNLEDVFKEIEESIFAEYTKLPEKLCDLLLINIGDTDPANRVVAYGEAIKAVISHCQIVKAIGKKRETVLKKLLLEEYDGSYPITAYDVVQKFYSLPKRLTGLPKSTLANLEKGVGKAAYTNFVVKESEEITLVA